VGDLVGREEDEEEGEEEEGQEVVQIRRADTMFQERYDYLGERKRKAYAEWKEGMLKRIKELEAR
jgi:origin recognition complex subunit 6